MKSKHLKVVSTGYVNQKVSKVKLNKQHHKDTRTGRGRTTLDLANTGDYYSRRNATGRGMTVIFKSGRINKKAVNKLMKQVDNEKGLYLTSKTKLKSEILDEIDNLQRDILDGTRKGRITEQTLESRLLNDKTDKMLVNAGYDRISFAKELGIKEEDIDNIKWGKSADGSTDMFEINGRKFEYKFNYNGEMFKEI